MTQPRITRADLEWWLERAAQLEWRFASTYAETAPHSYVVAGRTRGMSSEDYVRAARVIHTFGRPAKFYGMTSIYLTSPDGRLKWWTMARDVRETGLVNQATTDRLYGVQNAPDTRSREETPYDEGATFFDELHPTSDRLADALRSTFEGLSGPHAPAVLDVGCGTGRVLDLALTSPDRYAGVDPSSPMLNQLVRKHPSVAAVHPIRIEEALDRRLFTPGQFEVVSVVGLPSGSLTAETMGRLAAIASRGLVVAVGDEVEVWPSRLPRARMPA